LLHGSWNVEQAAEVKLARAGPPAAAEAAAAGAALTRDVACAAAAAQLDSSAPYPFDATEMLVACGWLRLRLTLCIMRHPSPRPPPAATGASSATAGSVECAAGSGGGGGSHTGSPCCARKAARRAAGIAMVSSTAEPRVVWRSGRVIMPSSGGGAEALRLQLPCAATESTAEEDAAAAAATLQWGVAPGPSSTGAPSEPEKQRASSSRSAGGVRSCAAAAAVCHPRAK